MRWSVCADAQAGLRLCFSQTSEDMFARVEGMRGANAIRRLRYVGSRLSRLRCTSHSHFSHSYSIRSYLHAKYILGKSSQVRIH